MIAATVLNFFLFTVTTFLWVHTVEQKNEIVEAKDDVINLKNNLINEKDALEADLLHVMRKQKALIDELNRMLRATEEKYPPKVPGTQFVCPDDKPGICYLYGAWLPNLDLESDIQAADAASPLWTFHQSCPDTAKTVRKPTLETSCYGYWQNQP